MHTYPLLISAMNAPTSSHWICQICKRPADAAGVIEIINANIDLGDVGSHPVQLSDDPHALGLLRGGGDTHGAVRVDRDLGAMLSEILAHVEESRPNVGFVVRHVACISDKSVEGYVISTDRAATLSDWVGWVLHVGHKSWMGTGDILRMAEFWWKHKGEQPPEPH